MSIFDIDYINVVWKLLVPPDKRQPGWMAWGNAVMAGKQWCHNAVFTTYAGGDYVDFAYDPTATYSSGQRAIYYLQSYTSLFTGSNAYYGDNAVYEALCINPDGSVNGSGFSGIPPTGGNILPQTMPSYIINTTQAIAWLYNASVNYPIWQAQSYIAGQIVLYTDGNAYQCIVNATYSESPSNATHWKLFGKPGCSWVKVCNNFLGANERINYSAQKLIFEYALNRWFNTKFRQPNGLAEDPVHNFAGTSDIYISINSDTTNQFFWGQPPPADTLHSFFGPATNISDLTIPVSRYFTPGNSFLLHYDYSIYIPVAVYNALANETPVAAGGNTTRRDAIVSAFANLLNPAGSFYNIITY